VCRRFTSPSCLTLDSARHAVCTAWLLIENHNNCRERVKQVLLQKRAARPFIFPANGPSWVLKPGSKTLVLFLTRFLAATLSSQRFFYSLSLAGLQVKRVTLYFFNNVLSLYLPFEPSQRVFEGFTLLKSNFRQRTTPPHPS